MGSEKREEEKRGEEFEKLIDVAYQLFDGKYNMDEITNMPYKKLINEMDKEREFLKQNPDARSGKQIAKALTGKR